jgi:hypothetical protein
MAGINIYKHKIGFILTQNEKQDILNMMVEEYHVVLHPNHFTINYDDSDYDFNIDSFFGSYNPLNNIEYVLSSRYFGYNLYNFTIDTFQGSKVDLLCHKIYEHHVNK